VSTPLQGAAQLQHKYNTECNNLYNYYPVRLRDDDVDDNNILQTKSRDCVYKNTVQHLNIFIYFIFFFCTHILYTSVTRIRTTILR